MAIQTTSTDRLATGDVVHVYGATGRVVTANLSRWAGDEHPVAVNMVRMLAIPADSTFATLGARDAFLAGDRLWNEQGNRLATSYIVTAA